MPPEIKQKRTEQTEAENRGQPTVFPCTGNATGWSHSEKHHCRCGGASLLPGELPSAPLNRDSHVA